MTNVYAYRGRRRDPLAKLYVPAILLLGLAIARQLEGEPAAEQPEAKAKPAPYIRLQSRAEREGTDAPHAREPHSANSRDTDTSPFSGCNEARAAGHEDIPEGSPLYGEHMDGDHDGLACEPVKQPRRR